VSRKNNQPLYIKNKRQHTEIVRMKKELLGVYIKKVSVHFCNTIPDEIHDDGSYKSPTKAIRVLYGHLAPICVSRSLKHPAIATYVQPYVATFLCQTHGQSATVLAASLLLDRPHETHWSPGPAVFRSTRIFTLRCGIRRLPRNLLLAAEKHGITRFCYIFISNSRFRTPL